MKASDVKVLMQLIKETSQFALFSDKHLCLYPIENFNREKPLVSRRFDEQVKDLGSIPRGPLLLLCRGQTDLVYTLDKVKLEKLFVFVLPYESIKLSCSSSSLFAVLCSDSLSSSSSLHIYDCIGRIEQGSIEHPRRIVDFQFSYTNEHLIAAVTNEETLLFDTRRRELLKSTAGHHRGNLSLAWNKVKDELYTSGMDRTIKVFNAELELIAKKPIFENVSLLHHFKLQAHSLLATAFYRNEAGVTVWELPDLNSALYNSRGEKDSKIVDFDIDPNSLCIVTLTHRGVSVSPLVLCEDSQKSAPNFACFAFDGRENFCASDQSSAFALFRVAGDPQKFSRSEKLAELPDQSLNR